MFNSLRQKIIGQFTAAAVAAGAVLAPTLAYADDAQVAALTAPRVGKPVILRIGPEFNVNEANLMAAFLNREGCPTTVTTERGLPRRVGVQVGDKSFYFTKSLSAGSQAIDWCLDNS